MTPPTRLSVEIYAGHKGVPTPRSFCLEGIRLGVREITAHWETEHHGLFKLIASDGCCYTLRYHLDELVWELVMREGNTEGS
jgi:hypothetical protein